MKKILPVLFLSLLVAGLLSGCSKEHEYTVYGTVFYDGSPAQGAKVRVSGADGTIAQTVTGSDGTYEISFCIDDVYSKWCGDVSASIGWDSAGEELVILKNSTQPRINIDIVIK